MTTTHPTIETIYKNALSTFCSPTKLEELTSKFSIKLSLLTKHFDFANRIELFLSKRMAEINHFILENPNLEVSYYLNNGSIDVVIKQKQGKAFQIKNHAHFFADLYHQFQKGIKVACISDLVISALLNEESVKVSIDDYDTFIKKQGNGWHTIQVLFSMMNDDELSKIITEFNSTQKMLEFEQTKIQEIIYSGLQVSLPHTQFIKNMMMKIHQHWNKIENKNMTFDELIQKTHKIYKNNSNAMELGLNFMVVDFIKLYAQWEFIESTIKFIINNQNNPSHIVVDENGILSLFLDTEFEFIKQNQLYGDNVFIKDKNYGLKFYVNLLEPIQLNLNAVIADCNNIDGCEFIPSVSLKHQCGHETISCTWENGVNKATPTPMRTSTTSCSSFSLLPDKFKQDSDTRKWGKSIDSLDSLDNMLAINYLNQNDLMMANIKTFVDFLNDFVQKDILVKTEGIVVEELQGMAESAKWINNDHSVKIARRIVSLEKLIPIDKNINGLENKPLIWDNSCISHFEFCLLEPSAFQKALSNIETIEIKSIADYQAKWNMNYYIYQKTTKFSTGTKFIETAYWDEFRDEVDYHFWDVLINCKNFENDLLVIVEYQYDVSNNSEKWIVYSNSTIWGMEGNIINNPYFNLSNLLS